VSDKSKKVLNDYLNTLLDMSEPPASEQSPAKVGVTNNLISFPEPVIPSQPSDLKIDQQIGTTESLKPKKKTVSTPSEPKLGFKEQDIVKVDLTSHVRLNLAQKLLQDYQLRTQQKQKTDKAQQTHLKIQELVKHAVDCEISIDQQIKLLTLLKAKNLTQEMEIVEASIKVMQEQEQEQKLEQELEQQQKLQQHTLEITEVKSEIELASAPPHELKSDSSLNQSFQCLIFNVGNLKVAVPLSKLGGIHELKDDLTSIPGKPPWYIGIIDYAGDNYHVVDTAYWITPEHSSQMDLNYQYFIVMGDSKWGLGCTSIGNAVTINKSDIRWASKNSKKSWFAGMLVDEMCALLDIDNFIEELLVEQ
jgi:purine-binding chemotaxis protein CheW